VYPATKKLNHISILQLSLREELEGECGFRNRVIRVLINYQI
jgi:hypothetical protein